MYKRFAERLMREALADTPVVLIVGPRRAGKTTLVRKMEEANRRFLTFDAPIVLDAARTDPVGFVRGLDRVILDEVQRVPELLLAIKRSVDEDYRPGRFLLTGSANVMHMKGENAIWDQAKFDTPDAFDQTMLGVELTRGIVVPFDVNPVGFWFKNGTHYVVNVPIPGSSELVVRAFDAATGRNSPNRNFKIEGVTAPIQGIRIDQSKSPEVLMLETPDGEFAVPLPRKITEKC